jgi:hypothetical protein
MKPMEKKFKSTSHTTGRSCGLVCAVAIVLQFGVLADYAQTGTYLFTGSEMTITLNPGTYAITAYGAQGGWTYGGAGGLGAEMSAQFSFSALTTLTLLVGGVGGGYAYGGGGSFVVNGSTPLVIAGGGGGAGGYGAGGTGLTGTSGGQGLGALRGLGGASGYGGNFGYFSGGGGGYYGNGTTQNNPYAGGGGGSFLNGGYGGALGYGDGGGGFGGGGAASSYGYAGGGGGGYSGGGGGGAGGPSDGVGGGGGGGSYVDSSAVAVLAEISGVASPDGSPNGEIIVMVIPEPTTLALAGLSGLGLLLFRRRPASDCGKCSKDGRVHFSGRRVARSVCICSSVARRH